VTKLAVGLERSVRSVLSAQTSILVPQAISAPGHPIVTDTFQETSTKPSCLTYQAFGYSVNLCSPSRLLSCDLPTFLKAIGIVRSITTGGGALIVVLFPNLWLRALYFQLLDWSRNTHTQSFFAPPRTRTLEPFAPLVVVVNLKLYTHVSKLFCPQKAVSLSRFTLLNFDGPSRFCSRWGGC
jgi:hypothetical protein